MQKHWWLLKTEARMIPFSLGQQDVGLGSGRIAMNVVLIDNPMNKGC